MKKILNYLIITLITVCVLYNLIMFGFTYFYFHGTPSSPSKIEKYEFNTTAINLKKEFKTICDKSKYLSYKDSVDYDNVNTGNVNTIQITKKGEKLTYFLRLNEVSDNKNKCVKLYLYYINGKGNDSFGWFSLEKYRKVKLFEETIITPLSKKI
ncbi:hypothetical protein IUY40_16695 [Flavobacterium sp. ALJ2]|uniref:hypothetical protein n=1 Tax=Flavobacterium sp. ALJ2 TaxID=2786960 RepID=UPI00189DE8F6|nr:hypothetical protein [Flavobacterium sp. ALJ2]MBF7093172.1 hypothetical protein [Flavobacterium sp. ALJ2]